MDVNDKVQKAKMQETKVQKTKDLLFKNFFKHSLYSNVEYYT